MEELFEDIQTYLNKNTTSNDKQEYEKLLEEFNQIPSYVERFTQREETQQ